MDNIFYLFIAYTFIWVLISWYVFRLGRRQTSAQNELNQLKEMLNLREGQ